MSDDELLPELAGTVQRLTYEGQLVVEVEVDANGRIEIVGSILYTDSKGTDGYLDEDGRQLPDPFADDPRLEERLVYAVRHKFPNEAEIHDQ